MKLFLGGIGAVAVLVAVVSSDAQTWNQPGNESWITPANWSPATVPNAAGASVTFNGAATANNPDQAANRTITLDGQQTIGSILFNNDLSTFTNSITTGTASAPALTFDNNGSTATITTTGSGTGNNTFTASFKMNSSVTAFVNNTAATSAAGSLNITGTITGAGGFTKEGLGTATFGTNTKTYSGPTNINNGRMRISVAARPSATSSLTVNNGGQLDLIAAGNYTFGSSPINLNGSGPTSGPTAANPGAIRPDTNLVTSITNASVLQTTSLVHVQGMASGALTFSGAISGPGGFIAGAASHDANVGQIIFDTATNSYTGGTTVNVGSLVAGATSTTAFGTGNVSVISANAAFGGAIAVLKLTAGETNAIANNATLSLAGGNVPGVADDGYINLDSGVNETVGGLILGGVAQSAAGTYGASGSGAAHIFDEYFFGGGVVTLTPSAGVAGDYNGNGVVDMADYVLWRNGGPLQNEVASSGVVDAADYTAWRARFGNTSGSGSALGGTAVPEPATLLFATLALSFFAATSRVRTILRTN